MPKNPPAIAAAIRAARERSGLTQAESAEKAGITLRSYQRFESGERSWPRIDILIRLAEVFRCSLDELVGVEPLPEKGRRK
jgi:transcriptional regulator with XRE-family HTH domain